MTLSDQQEALLRQYADGLLGTSQAIERMGIEDFADLLVALAERNLDLPKPADTPNRRVNVERARVLLEPHLLRHDD